MNDASEPRTAAPGFGNTALMPGTQLSPRDVRLMQGLAQQVTALRPELQNNDATVGELAWVWGKDHADLGSTWRHRLWFAGGNLAGWGWASLPHQVMRSDGQVLHMTMAALTWQVHPDSPHLLDDILDTGHTLHHVVGHLRELGPASVRVAVLLRKQGRQSVPFEPDYCGFTIPDAFVVGYGLDHNDEFRHLPYIAVLPEKVGGE